MKDQAKTREFEEKLKESENLYQAAIDSIDTVLYVVDSDLRLISINNAFVLWCEDLGIDTDMIGKTIFEVFAFLPERVRDEYRQVFETGKTVITIDSNVVGDSEIITETRKSPIIRDNKVEQVITVVQDITEPKRAEEALSESEEKYRIVVERSLQGIMIAQGPSPRIVFTNPAMSKILGYPTKEFRALTPKEIGKLIHPEDQEKVLKRFKDRLEGKKVVPHYEFRMIRKNGEEIWVEMSSTQIIYEGKPAIQAALNDITDHKKAEDALSESEKKYRDLVENINDVVYSTDKEGVITYMSPVVQALAGYSPSEIVGKNFSHFLHKEDFPRIQNMFKQVLKGHLQPSEYRITTKNRGVRWVRTSSRPIMGNDGPVGLQGVMTDITEYKWVEEQVHVVNDRLQYLLSASSAVIYTAKASGNYGATFISENVTQMVGFEPMEFLGDSRFWISHVHPDDVHSVAHEVPLIFEKKFHSYEYRFKCKDGKYIWVHDEMKLVRDQEGNPLEIIGYWLDLSDRKEAENQVASLAKFPSENPNPVLRVSREGSILYANDASKPLLDDWCSKTGQLVPAPWNKLITESIDSGQSRIEEIKSGDRILSIVTAPNVNAGYVNLYGRDITERKRAEEALRESEGRFSFAFENANIGMCLVDLDGRLIRVNSQMCKIFGYTQEELEKMTVTEIAHPEDVDISPKFIQQAKSGAIEHTQFEKRYFHKQGHIICGQVSSSLIRNFQGAPLYFISHIQDITVRKRAEEELKKSREALKNLAAHFQSGREEERASIAREIHDELGQALTALKMDLFWLRKRLPEDQRPYLEKIQSMVDLADRTIVTMKRISTDLRPSMLDDLGLVAAIEWQAEEFQKRTEIKCDAALDFEEIELDEERTTTIFRIFQETLTNIARHADATIVRIYLRKRAKNLELEVRDNGKGITEEQISDPKAYGLIGMRERVQFMEGEITISGAANKGTKVLVKIPLADIGAVG